MSQIIPAYAQLSQIVPDWVGAARADCVPGSGLPYVGSAALVLAVEKLVVVTPDARVIQTVFYESIVRVREIEFKGLIIERDGVLVAPNETFGVEIVYKGVGSQFERNFKLLTRAANNARALTDVIANAVTSYLDATARGYGIVKRTQE
ncbi:MAG: hypothetical protein K8L97_20640 [Anaerolineae bacterium]|nr:hypothetical protein [Anaerolineae bacterium]